MKGSECLGADTLLQLLKNYARGSSGLKQSITVGVVGFPNVGKSSLINSLKRTRVAQVGNAPGVTKGVQEVHLDKQVTLLDSPGVVFSDAGVDGAAAAALRNCVKVEQLEDPVLPVAEIVKRCPAKQLMTLYKVPAYKDVDGFLTHVATARGKLRRGGVVDTSAAARIVLQDWNDGRIPYFTRPSKRQTEIQGTVVDGLPSLDDAAAGFFQTETVGAAHVNLDAPIEEDEESDEEKDAMSSSDIDDDDEDQDVDAMDDREAAASPARVTRSSKDAQNTQLYGQKGQFNPKLAKAQRKKAKKESGGKDGADSDSDFDFEEVDFDDAKHANAFAELASDEEDEDGSDME
jgi:nuclear GTP-binding protein